MKDSMILCINLAKGTEKSLNEKLSVAYKLSRIMFMNYNEYRKFLFKHLMLSKFKLKISKKIYAYLHFQIFCYNMISKFRLSQSLRSLALIVQVFRSSKNFLSIYIKFKI